MDKTLQQLQTTTADLVDVAQRLASGVGGEPNLSALSAARLLVEIDKAVARLVKLADRLDELTGGPTDSAPGRPRAHHA
jgi:thiamine biosynthesis lipoprotein ApbE